VRYQAAPRPDAGTSNGFDRTGQGDTHPRQGTARDASRDRERA